MGFKSLIAASVVAAATMITGPVAASTVTVSQGATLVGDGGNIEPGRGTSIASNNPSYSSEATTPTSEWVWVGNTETVNSAVYLFEFDLTRYDLSTVSLSGLWGVDNTGQVRLNGTLIAELPNVVVGNFNALHSYGTSDPSLFVDGHNELQFNLFDATGQAAFRATAEVTAAAIPLPAGGVLLLLGLAGLAALRRPGST